MTNKDVLEASATKLKTQLNTVLKQLDRLKTAKELPELKKKYEGKYFKYRNCYSCPEKDEDYWWMYLYVTEVKELRDIRATSFQTDSYGKIEIEIDKYMSVGCLGVPSTKSEFYANLSKVRNKLNKI